MPSDGTDASLSPHLAGWGWTLCLSGPRATAHRSLCAGVVAVGGGGGFGRFPLFPTVRVPPPGTSALISGLHGDPRVPSFFLRIFP